MRFLIKVGDLNSLELHACAPNNIVMIFMIDTGCYQLYGSVITVQSRLLLPCAISLFYCEGNKLLLSYDKNWEALIEHYEEKECVVEGERFCSS